MQNAHIAALFKLHGKPFGRDILRRKIQLRRSGEIERFRLDEDVCGEEISSKNENENDESERAENDILIEHEDVVEGSNSDLETTPISSDENREENEQVLSTGPG